MGSNDAGEMLEAAQAECVRLERALATARDDALEEAALAAESTRLTLDDLGYEQQYIVETIRELKGTRP